ncbi:MAG TPA: hypothetical protein VH988_30050 [Thermoanaerobaculia bacterium]|jgi:hypothetical protein|nr:hypothetical protein [Thermoanaerobaculia bacterium]
MSQEEDLQQMVEQLTRLYEVLLILGRDIAPQNPILYSVMAEGPVDQIEDLRRQIDETVGLAFLQELRADVWLSIEGDGIEAQNAPSSLLASYLDVVRKGVQAIAEINLQGSLSTRPTKDLQEACDLQLVALQAGSVRLGLRLPNGFEEREHPDLTESQRAASGALAEYLEVASWAVRDGNEQWLSERFPEPAKRKVLLGAVKSLAPGKRSSVDSVSLSGRRVPGLGPVTLTRGTKKRLDRALELLVEDRRATYKGVLREIDLDRRTFLIRGAETKTVVRCSFPQALSDLAKASLDRLVIVTGAVRHDKRRRDTIDLEVQDLAIASE